MHGFGHATILSPSFHGLRQERLALTPLLCPKYKNLLQIMSLAAYASETKESNGLPIII